MSIVPELSPKECNTLQSILKQIDGKLYKIAKNTYTSIAYEIGKENNEAVETLITYKYIVLQKFYGCCFTSYTIEQIISKIKNISV